jgi:hypothetical protein
VSSWTHPVLLSKSVGQNAAPHRTDPKEATTSRRDTAFRANLDLTRVDEVGVVDMTRGSGHGLGGSVGIDWIGVYGKPVMR